MDTGKPEDQATDTKKILWLPGWTTPGWLLAGFAMVSIFMLALTFETTRTKIAMQEKIRLENQLKQLLPANSYDNEPTQDIKELTNPTRTVYRARIKGEPVAALFRTVSPDGYSGSIELLVGIKADGSLLGVRALKHQETPGLGDDIDLRKSDWILGFNGRSLTNPETRKWAVKKDGGEFDSLTGATITPRAVIKETRNTLLYFSRHRDGVFQ